MCYSAGSSLRTSLISGAAIAYLLLSGLPHYQWLGLLLVGWCGMQFAEYLLWSTNPAKGCTPMNKLITLTLIPLVLMLQPLGSLFGSFFVTPWSKSSDFRKQFVGWFSAFVVAGVSYVTYYDMYKTCTIVTDQYHLYWLTSNYVKNNKRVGIYFLWAIVIGLPLILYWNRSWVFLGALLVTPIFGFMYGLYTDSRASLWCYYTSYTSVIAALALAAKQLGFGDAMYAKLF